MSDSPQANGNGDANGWFTESRVMKESAGLSEQADTPPKINGVHAANTPDAEVVDGIASPELPESDEEPETTSKKLLPIADEAQSSIAPPVVERDVEQEIIGNGGLQMDDTGSKHSVPAQSSNPDPIVKVDASSPVGNGKLVEVEFSQRADVPVEDISGDANGPAGPVEVEDEVTGVALGVTAPSEAPDLVAAAGGLKFAEQSSTTEGNAVASDVQQVVQTGAVDQAEQVAAEELEPADQTAMIVDNAALENAQVVDADYRVDQPEQISAAAPANLKPADQAPEDNVVVQEVQEVAASDSGYQFEQVAAAAGEKPADQTALPDDHVAVSEVQEASSNAEQDAIANMPAEQSLTQVIAASQMDDAGLEAPAALGEPPAVSEAPVVADTAASSTMKAPVGLGLGLKLPARALRTNTTSNSLGTEQPQNPVGPVKEDSPGVVGSPSTAIPAVVTAAQSAMASGADAAAYKSSVEPSGSDAAQGSSAAAASQPEESKLLPRPALPARPSGLGSALPQKAKPAVAKRAKAQSFAAAAKAHSTSTAEPQSAVMHEESTMQDEELKAAQAQALKNARLVEKLPLKHANKVQEYQHLSAMVLQELNYLQAYHRQHTALAKTTAELSALIEAGKALGVGTKLGRMNQYVGNSTAAVGDPVHLSSLIEISEKQGFHQLHQALVAIRDESGTEDVTLGRLLHMLAEKVPASVVNQPAQRNADRPIEEVVQELDKAVEARTLLEQQQILQHLRAKDWSKSFSSQIELPRESLLAAALKLVLKLPLLPIKFIAGFARPSTPSAPYIVDHERFEIRRFEARLKLLRAYQQAVCEQTGLANSVQ